MLLAMAPGIFFIGPMQVNMVILVEDVLQESDKFVGILFGCFGAGVVIGSLLMTLKRFRRRGVVLISSLFIGCACFLAFGLSETTWLSAAVLFAFGMSAALFINLAVTLLQENTSREMMGRVMSIYSLGFLASQPVGLAQAGIISTVWGPQTSIIVSAAGVGIMAALCLLFLRPVRALD
jgi:predicted MFS family arabinose efflux permease